MSMSLDHIGSKCRYGERGVVDNCIGIPHLCMGQ